LKSKRGIFFSTDALIALTIIFLIVLIAFPIIKQSRQVTNLHYDILTTLSSLKTGEVDNTYVRGLISQGLITNLDKSILEQIGEFYVTNSSLAQSLANSVLSDIVTNENIGMWYGNNLIWSNNATAYETAKNIDTARQIISGIGGIGNESATGFAARAFLTSSLQKRYFYFGGYIGDGNITARIEYNGNITSAEMELAINNDFELYINGFPSPDNPYQRSPDEFTPVNYIINPGYLTLFNSGANNVSFRGNNLHIAGGFMKITYESEVQYEQPTRYYFPGIEGLINLYDGFYIPGNLNTLSILLHLDTNLTTFLNIGNVTVYNGTTNGEQTITILNSQLQTLLDYQDLNNKTIPLRLGLENVTFVINVSLDIISVADMSKGMKCSIIGQNCFQNQNSCEDAPPTGCGGVWLLPLNNSKAAHTLLVNKILLELTRSRVGIFGYHAGVPAALFHDLSNDSVSLLGFVDSWREQDLSSQNRKLCEGMDRAVGDFIDNSENETIKVMIAMASGEITHGCPINSPDNNENGVPDEPEDDAIQVACDAWENHRIQVHSVSYGDSSDDDTMQRIAACGGNGTWYSSDISGLEDLYEDIVNDIIRTYSQQTIEVVGGGEGAYTRLYPDSYIEFDYVQPSIPFGLIITLENQFNNETSGNFSVPADSTVIETRVSSYSGPRWTDNVKIDSTSVYKLSDYGQSYITLGDPYSINIQNSFIGSDNVITLTTGLSPGNSTSGSASNKIIYTINKSVSAFSPVSGSANGCIWNIQFEDDTNITGSRVPDFYNGTDNCYYAENGYYQGIPGPQIANDNDAFQVAVYLLLQQLDVNGNDKIDISFTEQDLQIDLTELIGIPFTWSTEVQVRVWS